MDDDDIWRLFCIFGIVGFFGMLAKSNWRLLSFVRMTTRFFYAVWYLCEDGVRALLKKPKKSRKPGRRRYY